MDITKVYIELEIRKYLQDQWIGNAFHELAPLFFLDNHLVIQMSTKMVIGAPYYIVNNKEAFLAYQFNYRGKSKAFETIQKSKGVITPGLVNRSNASKLTNWANCEDQIEFWIDGLSTHSKGMLVARDIKLHSGEKFDLEQVNAYLTQYHKENGNATSPTGGTQQLKLYSEGSH